MKLDFLLVVFHGEPPFWRSECAGRKAAGPHIGWVGAA
jgi:hypothetical protein